MFSNSLIRSYLEILTCCLAQTLCDTFENELGNNHEFMAYMNASYQLCSDQLVKGILSM